MASWLPPSIIATTTVPYATDSRARTLTLFRAAGAPTKRRAAR